MKKEKLTEAYELQEEEKKLLHWLETLEKDGNLAVFFKEEEKRNEHQPSLPKIWENHGNQVPLPRERQIPVKELLKVEIDKEIRRVREVLQELLNEK